MGSIISLGVDWLEVDWGKNNYFRNHSRLFLPGDVKPVTYYYADDIQIQKPGYCRPLEQVKERLDLLGYTPDECRTIFESQKSAIPNYYPEDHQIPYDVFARMIKAVNVEKVSLPDEPDHYDFGEYMIKNILRDPEFTKCLASLESFDTHNGEFFQNLDPYIILRLLAENEMNLTKEVIWRFADVVEGGWISEEELYEGLQDADRYLIVTEGSSDSNILKKSLELLRPDIADFFDFIDMSENYPFTGAGNLFRFCQGLARIRIQNRILVLLDNDTSGHEAYQKTMALDLPLNMRIALLPDLEECKSIRTIGPSGYNKENVNGRAISIELFLDLAHGTDSGPTIRWTSYNDRQNQYQGELIDKDAYTREFLRKRSFGVDYDTSKLESLWQHIVKCCTGQRLRSRST